LTLLSIEIDIEKSAAAKTKAIRNGDLLLRSGTVGNAHHGEALHFEGHEIMIIEVMPTDVLQTSPLFEALVDSLVPSSGILLGSLV